jgi:RNA polymerase sigma factor (TIGR02999 family)
MTDVTQILNQIEDGDPSAAEKLLPLVYKELRALAARRLTNEKPGQTLQPTALVHEAYIKLVDNNDQHWSNRRHFFGAAAEAMRRILVDNARKKMRPKHAGTLQRVELNEEIALTSDDADQILAINEALDKLSAEDAQKAELVRN